MFYLSQKKISDHLANSFFRHYKWWKELFYKIYSCIFSHQWQMPPILTMVFYSTFRNSYPWLVQFSVSAIFTMAWMARLMKCLCEGLVTCFFTSRTPDYICIYIYKNMNYFTILECAMEFNLAMSVRPTYKIRWFKNVLKILLAMNKILLKRHFGDMIYEGTEPWTTHYITSLLLCNVITYISHNVQNKEQSTQTIRIWWKLTSGWFDPLNCLLQHHESFPKQHITNTRTIHNNFFLLGLSNYLLTTTIKNTKF